MRMVSCGLPVSTIISESIALAEGRLFFHGFDDRWHPQNALVLGHYSKCRIDSGKGD